MRMANKNNSLIVAPTCEGQRARESTVCIVFGNNLYQISLSLEAQQCCDIAQGNAKLADGMCF